LRRSVMLSAARVPPIVSTPFRSTGGLIVASVRRSDRRSAPRAGAAFPWPVAIPAAHATGADRATAETASRPGRPVGDFLCRTRVTGDRRSFICSRLITGLDMGDGRFRVATRAAVRGGVTTAPLQSVLVPLVADLAMRGWIRKHVDPRSWVSSLALQDTAERPLFPHRLLGAGAAAVSSPRSRSSQSLQLGR
jgi:hypothetical protein